MIDELKNSRITVCVPRGFAGKSPSLNLKVELNQMPEVDSLAIQEIIRLLRHPTAEILADFGQRCFDGYSWKVSLEQNGSDEKEQVCDMKGRTKFPEVLKRLLLILRKYDTDTQEPNAPNPLSSQAPTLTKG
jgi:hypothetical protein